MAYSVMRLLVSFEEVPWYVSLFYVLAITTTERGLFVTFNVLQSISIWWVINNVPFYFIAIYTWLCSSAAIVHWSMTNMLFILCFIWSHYGFLFFSYQHVLFSDSSNTIFCCRHINSWPSHFLSSVTWWNHWKTNLYRGSDDCGEGDCDSDINCLVSFNLCQYITLTNQCEKLTLTWMWFLLYFYCWYHFEKCPGRVKSITTTTARGLFVAFKRSTFNIDTVSYKYCSCLFVFKINLLWFIFCCCTLIDDKYNIFIMFYRKSSQFFSCISCICSFVIFSNNIFCCRGINQQPSTFWSSTT